MSELTLLLSLLIAVAVPRIALGYLRPILLQVLRQQCEDAHATVAPETGATQDLAEPARNGAEFWWRVLNVLAISGSVLLVLAFGYRDGFNEELHDYLRRTLLLVSTGVFVSVGFVAWRVQAQVWRELAARERRLAPRPAGPAPRAPHA